MRELLTNYGPIGMIWFDTPKRMTVEQSRELVDLVHELQPDCLVNGRIGNGLGDYAETRDNVIPGERVELDWEVPATINDTWAFKSDDHNWKSVDDLIHKLVDVASKDGNYLLNVGPTAEGVIPAAERRAAAGDRALARRSTAIRSTAPGRARSKASSGPAPRSKDGTVYLHVFDWPSGGQLRLPASIGEVTHARLLADGTELPVRRESEGLVIAGPASAPGSDRHRDCACQHQRASVQITDPDDPALLAFGQLQRAVYFEPDSLIPGEALGWLISQHSPDRANFVLVAERDAELVGGTVFHYLGRSR